MKETGIVRRIDELGRVVIPKEIRKTQRIRTGDSLEIYTDGNGEVIFKKYSPLAELGEPAAVYADVLARRLRCAVAVCDREHIVAAAGAGKGELLGAPLPPEIEPLLTRRKLYTAPASAAEREPLGSRYLLCAAPILVHGDIEGGVLLARHPARGRAQRRDRPRRRHRRRVSGAVDGGVKSSGSVGAGHARPGG